MSIMLYSENSERKLPIEVIDSLPALLSPPLSMPLIPNSTLIFLTDLGKSDLSQRLTPKKYSYTIRKYTKYGGGCPEKEVLS